MYCGRQVKPSPSSRRSDKWEAEASSNQHWGIESRCGMPESHQKVTRKFAGRSPLHHRSRAPLQSSWQACRAGDPTAHAHRPRSAAHKCVQPGMGTKYFVSSMAPQSHSTSPDHGEISSLRFLSLCDALSSKPRTRATRHSQAFKITLQMPPTIRPIRTRSFPEACLCSHSRHGRHP